MAFFLWGRIKLIQAGGKGKEKRGAVFSPCIDDMDAQRDWGMPRLCEHAVFDAAADVGRLCDSDRHAVQRTPAHRKLRLP